MKRTELINYIGRRVKFKSNRTRTFLDPLSVGEVQQVDKVEVEIGNDWHEIKSVEVIELLPLDDGDKRETLKDWLGEDFSPFTKSDEKLVEWMDVLVVKDFRSTEVDPEDWDEWISKKPKFKGKYVFNWCVLANGYAVGWNENPSLGWSYPLVKVKNV